MNVELLDNSSAERKPTESGNRDRQEYIWIVKVSRDYISKGAAQGTPNASGCKLDVKEACGIGAVAGVTSIGAMLMRMQLRWARHVSRMEDHRGLPEIVLYGELAIGCLKRGALKKRYKDSLKQHLSLGHIDCHQWSTLASSRDSWRHTIHDAAASFENAWRVSLEEKTQRRKNRSSPISPKETFRCAFCDRTCLSHISLFSHQHACSKRR
ncbi:hypothetical protein WISP_37381 [Willisornis vidua]|uniref:C2H2-type domain-containing protein n=1 Tax=Willisornis vidua TaxID=1566151 RepID=A0ABQ9DI22_9PASS|nr:hypothetical protein WISP_37381 [Willisornis vidua]